MMRLRCLLGFHDMDLIATNHGLRWTHFGPISLSFYTCKCCGRRKTFGTNSASKHTLASAYMHRWRVAGHLPETDSTALIKAKSATVLRLVK